MATAIDGQRIAAGILASVKDDIARRGVTPGLAVLLVGDDPASHIYVRLKERAARKVGIAFFKKTLPPTARQTQINETIEQWNNDPKVQAILVQLPLPKGPNQDAAVAAILPSKDVDGFHPENQRLFLAGTVRLTPPPIAAALEALKATGVSQKGKSAALRVNSRLFGDMLAAALTPLGIQTYTLLPHESSNATRYALRAYDIIVSARGTPQAVTAGAIKNGAVLIDIGTTKIGKKIVGDFAPTALEKSAFYTPVPGGIGPLTVALLMRNVVALTRQ